ncbi:MAG: hypothetical protein EZS28_032198 [Streblomastix strix]|uniref:SPRY domain-containing protein n=1 Tax=Streblomastix strix TaxID=222440 RepID=A0A5J4UR59_9EUKA|nr:MAG: hypothetical protein EZS28_032198 [Streblomastix strix]
MYIRQHNSKSKSIQLESDEKLRIAEERARLAEERIRQGEEKTRAAEERARVSEEQTRISTQKEREKADQEQARVAEEQTRIYAQKEREKADQEQARLAQERARVAAKQVPKQSQIPASLYSALQEMNIPEGDKGRVEGSTLICQNGGSDNECHTITMDPIINDGVARFEVVFNGHEGEEFSLGIVEASQVFKLNDLPNGMNGNCSARYSNIGELAHRVYCITKDSTPINGNSPFNCGQKISIEIDMTSNPRKCVFFVNGLEQKNSVVNIPKAIRFYVFVRKLNSSFQVTRFERLQSSSARGVPGSKQWEWGKNWKQKSQCSIQ